MTAYPRFDNSSRWDQLRSKMHLVLKVLFSSAIADSGNLDLHSADSGLNLTLRQMSISGDSLAAPTVSKFLELLDKVLYFQCDRSLEQPLSSISQHLGQGILDCFWLLNRNYGILLQGVSSFRFSGGIPFFDKNRIQDTPPVRRAIHNFRL